MFIASRRLNKYFHFSFPHLGGALSESVCRPADFLLGAWAATLHSGWAHGGAQRPGSEAQAGPRVRRWQMVAAT